MVGDSRDGERVVPWEGEIRRSRVRLGSRGPEGGVLGSKQGCAVSVSFNYSLQGLPCMPLYWRGAKAMLRDGQIRVHSDRPSH